MTWSSRRKNMMKPVGEWNHMVITCDGPKIAVEVNGEVVSRMNLDEWTEPNRRPDGQPTSLTSLTRPSSLRIHRFARPRLGMLVQNIKIKPL